MIRSAEKTAFALLAALLLSGSAASGAAGAAKILQARSFGVLPDSQQDATPGVEAALVFAKKHGLRVIEFSQGRYEFWPMRAAQRTYFISNHDPVESRRVAIPVEGAHRLVIDGRGSVFIFHGLILPFSINGSGSVTLRNFTIEYATPHVLETAVAGTGPGFVDLKMPAAKSYVIEDHRICLLAEDWKQCAGSSQEFDAQTKAIAWHTLANLEFDKTRAEEISPGLVRVYGMPDTPTAGNKLVLWNLDRPDPAIWVNESHDVLVSNVNVQSSLGMGFLAQRSQAIHLDGFRVILGSNSERYVTTVADAVHFSQCRGTIVVENGIYENMLDDGINVHGVYLRVTGRPALDTIVAEWPHPQTYGFTFAAPGEHIEFVRASTLERYGGGMVKSVSRNSDRQIQIRFTEVLPQKLKSGDVIANLDWQPRVIYRNNIVRNNRCRGTIFKTTAGVLIEGNRFEHLSGPAVLLIADAIDWYESTPAQNVTIVRNEFVDQVSSYGVAPITIRPKVDAQKEGDFYNIANVVIRRNRFSEFQKPLMFASSVDGLIISDNIIELNQDFKPFNQASTPAFSFEHVRCINIGNNQFSWEPSPQEISIKDGRLIRLRGIQTKGEGSQGCQHRE